MPARTATRSSPRNCLVAAGDDGRTELLRRSVTCCWHASPNSRSRRRSSCGWRPRPASAWTRRSSRMPPASMRRRCSMPCASASPARSWSPIDGRAWIAIPSCHVLLQEAVYDDVLPGERTRWHSAFARTLEARTGVDAPHAAELAYHWYAAHDLPRALETSVAAGRAAEARYAFPEASVEYERAIELWDQVPDAEARAGVDRIALLASLAGVARFHEPARAVAEIQEAITLVDEAANPIRAGTLHEACRPVRLGLRGPGILAQHRDRELMPVPAERLLVRRQGPGRGWSRPDPDARRRSRSRAS